MNSAFAENHPFPQIYSKELLVIESGNGVWLTDRSGNKYLDLNWMGRKMHTGLLIFIFNFLYSIIIYNLL